MSSSLQGFVFEKNLNSRRSKCKMKVWESPFIPSHLTFKKFRISLTFSQSITQQSNKQSKLFIYYNIPKFRILGCYKPTTLKMNLVLEIRRGQQEKVRVWGGLPAIPLIGVVQCATTLKKQGYGSNRSYVLHPWCEHYRSSHIFGVTPTLGLFQQGITFSSNSCPFIMVRLF